MTTALLRSGPVPGESALVGQLAGCADELADLAGHGCLVETSTGRLVVHRLLAADPPALVVEAVVRGDLVALQSAVRGRRSTGLLPSGPVVEATLPGRAGRVAHLTLRDDGAVVGGAWLLVADDRVLSLAALREPAQRLAGLLACTGRDEGVAALASCLDGSLSSALPTGLREAGQLWVAAVPPGPDLGHDVVLRAVTGGCATLARPDVQARATTRDGCVFVVLGASRRTTAAQALRCLQLVVAEASRRLVHPLTAGLSDAVTADRLAVARRQAQAVAEVVPAGSCAALPALRPHVVLRHLGRALSTVPDLGQDPLVTLEDYDARRGGDLVATLRAWLDAFGDVPAAAAALDVHANTLRYRLKRAQEVLGVDLRCDVAARLDLHLRLHCRTASHGEQR